LPAIWQCLHDTPYRLIRYVKEYSAHDKELASCFIDQKDSDEKD